MENTIYLSLGSNMGDRPEALRTALASVARLIGPVTGASPVYETAPWGFEDPVAFLNMAAEVVTALGPEEVLDRILGIEQSMGRIRPASGLPAQARQYGPRIIDIDILYFGNRIIALPGLDIPHPRIPERRFVLVPMAALRPDMVDPVTGRTIAALLADCPDQSPVSLYLEG